MALSLARSIRVDAVRRILVLVLLVSVACGSKGTVTADRGGRVRFTAVGVATELVVRIAETDDERTRGLMGVAGLPENEGMAFVWDEPTTGTFWMKNTLIPLAIAFVDEDGRIVTIREMTPCEAEPCPSTTSEAPYVLAIEANAGWYERHGIGVGDTAELVRNDG